jgi:hypothetical protein
MFSPKQNENQSTICDFVPGYVYYNEIGYGLAETLVNLVEWMLGWRK